MKRNSRIKKSQAIFRVTFKYCALITFIMLASEYWKTKFDDWYSSKESDFANIAEIWSRQNKFFRDFWSKKISDPNYTLTNNDIEEIIRILDTNARGNVKANAVATLYLRQNFQEDLLKNIKSDSEKIRILTRFFVSNDVTEKIKAIDELFKHEEMVRGPRLTTQNGVFLNAMAYAYDPDNHINIVSLERERSAIEVLKIHADLDFDNDSYGKRLVLSNKILFEFFRRIGVTEHTSVIASFIWHVLNDGVTSQDEVVASSTTFALEKLLEEFLVSNWDGIEEFKQKKYEIYTKDGEIVGRQFKAGEGKIDILAREKENGNFVVIELKRNQTSDAVAGQILRYMNWIKKYLANGKEVKGIVIAGDIDDTLKLSLADRNDVRLMRYEIDFKLHDEPIT